MTTISQPEAQTPVASDLPGLLEALRRASIEREAKAFRAMRAAERMGAGDRASRRHQEITDEEAALRVRIASHPETRPSTLAALAADYEKEVRLTAARNPSTPPEALDELVALQRRILGGDRCDNPIHALILQEAAANLATR